MKKILKLMMCALPVVFFAACDDDKDLPDVEASITIDGGVRINDVIYVVQGDEFAVEGITVTNREHGKQAIITSAAYSWDYNYIGTSVTPPYGAEFNTAEMPVGAHLLQIECPLYAVDKTPAVMYMAYKVAIVESADDIPAGEATTEFAVRPGIKES